MSRRKTLIVLLTATAMLTVVGFLAASVWRYWLLPYIVVTRPAPCSEALCTPDPGSLRIAFSSDRSGGYEIYVMNANGSCPTRLTDFSEQYDAMDPRWSPDGSRILFELNYRGSLLFGPDVDLYTVTADGSQVTRLTRRGRNFLGRWSPDGSRIAFVSDRNGYRALYVMDADGSSQAQLTSIESVEVVQRSCSIAWSPDGTRVAFTAASLSEKEDVYIVDVDKRLLTNLTDDPTADDEFLTWTPGQDQVLFKSNRVIDGEEVWRLYIADSDGTKIQQLIDLNGPGYRLHVSGWVSTPSTLQIILDGWRQTYILDIECALDHRPPWGKIDSMPGACYRALADPSHLYPHSPSVALYDCPGAPQLTYGVVRGFPPGYAGPPRDNDGTDIVVMNLDGTGITNLTNCSARNVNPDWSP